MTTKQEDKPFVGGYLAKEKLKRVCDEWNQGEVARRPVIEGKLPTFKPAMTWHPLPKNIDTNLPPYDGNNVLLYSSEINYWIVAAYNPMMGGEEYPWHNKNGDDYHKEAFENYVTLTMP